MRNCNLLVAFVVLALIPITASAQGRWDTIAISGTAAPDNNGKFSSFSEFYPPTINDLGTVAFNGRLTQTNGGTLDDEGIYFGNGGVVTQIAREGDLAPDGNGTFRFLSTTQLVLNNSGTSAFYASFDGTSGGTADNFGILTFSGGSMTQVARGGGAAPVGNGTILGLSRPELNDSGTVVFSAWHNLSNNGNFLRDHRIYSSSGGIATQIAAEGDVAPDGNGIFDTFDRVELNQAGTIAFGSNLIGTSGGLSDNYGIYTASGGVTSLVVREGQVAPGGNGTFGGFNSGGFDSVRLNETGMVSFRGTLIGTSGGAADDSGIFRGDGVSIAQLVREGDAAPDGNGTFAHFNFLVTDMNNSGDVAFAIGLRGTSGGTTDNSGMFRASSNGVVQIAREGQAAPDNNGTFLAWGAPVIHDSGAVAFLAGFENTIGGSSDDISIMMGDGIDLIQAVREGQLFDGSAITYVKFNQFNDFASNPMNKHGQIAYSAELADGREVVGRFTPDLHWRSASSGNWDSSSNWTLGLTPDFVHDVFIDPSSSMVVTGPSSNTSVRSLTVGGGSGMATLELAGSELSVSEIVFVAQNGVITGNGQLNGDTVVEGTLAPGNSAGLISILGDLEMRSTAQLEIELGGTLATQFDVLDVSGNLTLDGDLLVSLINSHSLDFHQRYLIGEVGGTLSGTFAGLNEGDVVQRFGDFDLFITYQSGDGNDIGLFTAVPEPGSGLMLVIAAFGISATRRRRSARS